MQKATEIAINPPPTLAITIIVVFNVPVNGSSAFNSFINAKMNDKKPTIGKDATIVPNHCGNDARFSSRDSSSSVRCNFCCSSPSRRRTTNF